MLQPSWMVRRVRQMSLEEVASKAWVVARDRVEALRASREASQIVRQSDGAVLRALALPQPAPLRSAQVSLHGLAWDLGVPLDWRRGTRSPWPSRPSAHLEIRRATAHGDVRVRWELDRLQWLPSLALTRPELAWQHLRDFCAANPVGFGPAWTCAMEVALRLVSVLRAAATGDGVPANTRGHVLGLVVASARYIERHLSAGSSQGNHTLVEGLGLLWAGMAVDHPRAPAWRETGLRLLRSCALAQIQRDGTPAEQSVAYLGIVLDALLHAAMVAPLRSDVWERVEAAASVLRALSGPSGHPFDLGDRDDGCVGWGVGERSELYAGICTAVGRLRGRPDLLVNTAPAQDWANTLTDLRSPICLAAAPSPPLQHWPQGGMTQLTAGSQRVLFRHAPLGLAPLFGHGHHDPLAVLWRSGDVEILGDSGTGAYADAPEMRAYLRSQAAHNTWRDDRARAPRATGPFLQQGAYRCVLERSDHTTLTASAWLGGTRQQREVSVREGHLRIVDRPDAPTTATAWWCVGEGEAEVHEGVVTVRRAEGVLTLIAPKGVRVRLVRGAIHPVEGWRSGSYSEWHPSTAVELRGPMPATGWTTELRWEAQ